MKSLPLSLTLALAMCSLVVADLSAQYSGATPPPAELNEGWKDINGTSCRAWLTKLASDAFEGRGTGTKGYQRAADYVAARFREFGLEPIGDQGSYFQHVPFARLRTQPKKSWIQVAGKSSTRVKGSQGDFLISRDMSGRDRFGTGEFEGPAIVIVARGASSKLEDPSILNGKIVLVNSRNDLRAPLRRQIAEAKPRAVIVVRRRIAASLLQSQTSLVMAGDLLCSGWVEEKAARKLFSGLGLKAKLAEKPTSDGLEVFEPEGKLRVKFAAKREDLLVPNVIGRLRGSDPKLADEVVILGSHLDHLGRVQGEIMNGADDDGSGTTALLAIARAMSKNPKKPKRSVVFLAVCGEEMGLLGSRYYVENPIIPIEDTVCELQMDMIGRNEEHPKSGERARDNVDSLHLVGSKKLSDELHRMIIDCNEHLKFRFEYDEEDVYRRSDHYNFAKKGIPVAFVFSGFHRDYHKASDDVAKINFKKLVGVARLYYLVAFQVADQERRIVVDRGPLATDPERRER